MLKKIPVIEYKKDFSYTEITLCFPGGSSLEDDKTLGFAHFCEHLAFKLKYNGKSIFEFVSELGGSSNAYTSNDVIAFEISVQSKSALKVVSFLEKLFAQSFMTISDADFNEERKVVLEEMAMYDDNPTDRLSETLMHNMFASHIYGQKILGEESTVGNAAKKDIAAFWENRVCNSPFLVIAGGFDGVPSIKINVCDKVKKGRLTPWEEKKRFEISHKQDKCYFAAGWKLPAYSGRTEAALQLISMITYGMDGGVLYNKLVYESGLFDAYAEGIECGVLGSSFMQLFALPASKAKQRLEKWAEIWNSLEFTQSQVAKAREVLLSKEVFSSEGLGDKPSLMAKSYLIFKDAEKLDKDYFYEFNRLTADDLNRFKAENLNFDKVFIGFTKSPKCAFDINSLELPEAKTVAGGNSCEVLKSGKNKAFVRKLDASPFVTGCILKKGGLLMNLDALPGSFNLAVSSLFASADGMSFDETNAYLDKFGIKIKTICSNSYGGIQFSVRDSFADEAVEIVKRFFNNKIKAKDFENERQNAISDISLAEESPGYFIKKAALNALFGGTPWGEMPEGTASSLKKMTLDDMRKAKEIFMSRNSFVISLAGAAESRTAEKFLSYFPNDGLKLEAKRGKLKPLDTENLKIPVKGKDQVYLAKIFRAPSHFDEDFDTIRLFENYMSSERSPLFAELREKSGLVYTFSLAGTNTPVGGTEMFFAITSPEKAAAVQKIFDESVEKIRNGEIDEKRLNETKNAMATSFAKALQRSSFHANNIAIDEILGMKPDSYLKQIKRMNAITPEMIAQTAEKWLKHGKWILSGAV